MTYVDCPFAKKKKTSQLRLDFLKNFPGLVGFVSRKSGWNLAQKQSSILECMKNFPYLYAIFIFNIRVCVWINIYIYIFRKLGIHSFTHDIYGLLKRGIPLFSVSSRTLPRVRSNVAEAKWGWNRPAGRVEIWMWNQKYGEFYPPKWMVKIRGNPIKNGMIWGVFPPLFLEEDSREGWQWSIFPQQIEVGISMNFLMGRYGCFQRLGIPQNGWFFWGETLLKMDDLGGNKHPYFWVDTHL